MFIDHDMNLDEDAEGFHQSDDEQKHPIAGPSNHRGAPEDAGPSDVEMDEEIDDNPPAETDVDDEYLEDT